MSLFFTIKPHSYSAAFRAREFRGPGLRGCFFRAWRFTPALLLPLKLPCSKYKSDRALLDALHVSEKSCVMVERIHCKFCTGFWGLNGAGGIQPQGGLIFPFPDGFTTEEPIFFFFTTLGKKLFGLI